MTESVKAVPRVFAFMPAAGTRELYGFCRAGPECPIHAGLFFMVSGKVSCSDLMRAIYCRHSLIK